MIANVMGSWEHIIYAHVGILKSYYNKRELSHKIHYANLNLEFKYRSIDTYSSLNSYSLLVPSTAFHRQSKSTNTCFHTFIDRLQQSNLSHHQLGLSLVIKDMCFLALMIRLPVYNSDIN